MSTMVPSGYPSFLPQPKDKQVRLIGDFKLPVGVNVSVNGCLSLYVSPVMNRQLVQCQPGLAPAPPKPGIGKDKHLQS